jgi:hypothetical protein
LDNSQALSEQQPDESLLHPAIGDDEDTQKKVSEAQRRDIIDRCVKRRDYNETQDKHNRDAQDADTRFVYVPMATWDADIVAKRTAWGDPCLEFPQLKQFINQVVNDQRQRRPRIKVNPASDEASVETATILQGMVRAIENACTADSIYDCGYLHSVVGGRGYWRVLADYEDEASFNQCLKLQRISDPNCVRMDTDYTSPDGSDINWATVEESVSKDDFADRWPNAEPMSWDNGNRKWWVDEDHVIVVDYYERVTTTRTLVALRNGTIGFEDDLKKIFAKAGGELHDGVIHRRRTSEKHEIKWYTIAGGEQVLEEHKWPGSVIPIICTMGDEIMVDGKRVYQGLISQAKAAQSLFNYGMTNQAIHLALTPRAPYIAAAGQIDEYKEMWEEANNRNYAVLVYDPVTVNDQLAPPPQRTPPSSPDAGWINWTQQMTMLMKSCIGMYENNLGMRGQEISGRAIKARESQGDNATFHYADNFARAIALTGRILVECIPYFYDTARIVHIIGDDDVRKPQPINQPMAPPPMQLGQLAQGNMPPPPGAQPMPMAPQPGQPPAGMPPTPGAMPNMAAPDLLGDALKAIAKNDVRVGKYSVVVDSGPGYQTKRQEAADLIMQLVKAAPQIMNIAPDLVVKSQDLPDAQALADRFQATLPPQIQAIVAAKAAGTNPQVASLSQQLQQAQQKIQEMTQAMQAAEQQAAQMKADKEANIAASAARKSVAEAAGAQAAARGQNEMAIAQMTDAREQKKIDEQAQSRLMKHMDDQEKRAIERDAVIVQLVGIIQKGLQPQAAAADVGVSGTAIKGQE